MALLEDFLPDIQGEVDGCPVPRILNTVVSVAADFCEQTLLFQYTGAPITVAPTTMYYDIPLPNENVRVAQIIAAYLNDRELEPVPMDEAHRMRSSHGFLQVSPTTIQLLIPTPVEKMENALVIKTAVAPTFGAEELDDDLYNRWFDVICAGAKAQLMNMPKKTWTNPALAAFYDNQYKIGVNKALVMTNKGSTRAELRVQPRRFA
jgi:hypothetical protein